MEPSTETLQQKSETKSPEQKIRMLHVINGALFILINMLVGIRIFTHKPHIALPELLLINVVWIYLWRKAVLTERNHIKDPHPLSQAEADAIEATQKSNRLLFKINYIALSIPVLVGVLLLLLTALSGDSSKGDTVDEIINSIILLNVPLTITWATASIVGYYAWKQNKALGIIITLLVPLYSCIALYTSLQ